MNKTARESSSTENTVKGNASQSVATPGLTATAVASRLNLSRGMQAALALLGIVFLWAYWSTFVDLVHTWNTVPDYSHGYIVVPLALLFLWLRRDSMPQPSGPGWGGVLIVLAALAMHLYGAVYYLAPLNGWSMSLWLTGAIWLVLGRSFCLWCLPGTLFLLFMVPLPYSLETAFRQPLQRIATEVSCWMLQSLGIPAVAAGNVISTETAELEVAQACSGLRIFVSIVALAFAYAVVVRRPWWNKVLIMCSVLPIAVLANALRVTLIAVADPYLSSQEAHRLVHDFAGWLVIPVAAALMGAFIWYLGKLLTQVHSASARELLQA
jgi:exosortase